MEKELTGKNYGGLAFIPMLVFLLLYVGVGTVLAILGWEDAFYQFPRYTAALVAVAIALLCYDRKKPLSDKVDIYCAGAGDSNIMLLGLVLLLAGAFNGAATAMGGRESIVNLGLDIVPVQFLVPGIFIISSFVSTCIGSSVATQVAVIPIAMSIAQSAGLNVGMAGAAAISGAYFGDNLSMISDSTICATKGVGAEMKDKFKMNGLIALPAALITIVLYMILSNQSGAVVDSANLEYSIVKIIPYIAVLCAAISGMDVILVLLLGTGLSGVVGIASGAYDFFGFTKAVGSGMEDMFFLSVFAMMLSGLIALVRYYGGITWLVETLSEKIAGRKGCEYVLSLISIGIAGTTLNNTVAIIIAAPIAKEMGGRFHIAPKRLASLLDIFACSALMLAPHDSAVMLVGQYGGADYGQIIIYAFYPILLLLFTVFTIQFGLLRTPEEKAYLAEQATVVNE